jgi:hypothetical protein
VFCFLQNIDGVIAFAFDVKHIATQTVFNGGVDTKFIFVLSLK